MPIKPSAKKALRQSIKRAKRNKKVKEHIKFLVKKFRKASEKKSLQEAQEFLVKAKSAIDKAVQKGILKKNTAARKKSRMMKRFHQLQQ